MSLPLYQVHYPKIGKITIKIDDVIMKYNHNDIVIEQAFFSKYPHIFKPRPDLKDIDSDIISEPKEKRVENESAFVPVQVVTPKEQAIVEIPVPVPTPTPETILDEPEVEEVEPEVEEVEPEVEEEVVEYEIQKAGKGWYRVINNLNGEQEFPIDITKKCRNSAAQEFISNKKDTQNES